MIPTIQPIFRWYDAWVGLFWERKTHTLYFFPFPFLGLKMEFQR